MSVNDNNSKWNKIRNKADCEITQPVTPTLCYPKSDVTNHPFTEKLFKYRKLHGNKCDPNPSQPCILDHTGLVLPGAVPEPPSTDIVLKSVGNKLVVWVCEDFFSREDDEEKYKNNYNGTVLVPVKKIGKDESGKDVYEDLDTSTTNTITDIYNDFVENLSNYSVSEEDDLESQKKIFIYSTSKIEDSPSDFPDYFTTYFKYSNTDDICSINFEEIISQDYPGGGNQTTSGVNLVLKDIKGGISIVLPNTYVQWYQEGVDSVETAQINVNNLAITQAYSTIECYVGNDAVTGTCTEDTHLVEEKELIIGKNRFKQTLDRGLQTVEYEDPKDPNSRIVQVTWGKIKDSIPNNTIDSWKDIYDETNTLAQNLLNTSLKCEYGNLEQTAYCTYPVLYSSKDTTKTAVYGLLPDQLVKHDDELKDGCAITTDSLISISSLNEDDPNNKTHVKYENNTYNYFTINTKTGEYSDGSEFSIVKPPVGGKPYFTLGKYEGDEGKTCNFDYCFDRDNITNGKLNVKIKQNKKAGYYIDPFYSGENNSSTVTEHSITKIFTYGELNDDTFVLEQEVNDLDAQAFTQASTSLFCQYGNPFYGAHCPEGTELSGGSQCTITTSVEKFIINDIEVCVVPNEELRFYLQTEVGDCYSVGSAFTPELNTCYINKEEQSEFTLNSADTAYVDCPTWEEREKRTECNNFVKHKFSISVNNNRNDDKNVDFSQVATLIVYTLDENDNKIKLAEITNIQPILSPIQKSYDTYDACLDKNTLTSQSNTAEALNSAKTIVDSQLQGCLIQNVEVKAFCDKLSMYMQMLEDLLNDRKPTQFTDWTKRIIVNVNRLEGTKEIEQSPKIVDQQKSLAIGEGIIYAYLHENHTLDEKSLSLDGTDTKFYFCYDSTQGGCDSEDGEVETTSNKIDKNGLEIYADTSTIDTATKLKIMVEAEYGFYCSRDNTETGSEGSEFVLKYLIVKNGSTEKYYKGFSHCLAIEPNYNSVAAGSYNGKSVDELETLNEKALSLAISGLSCLYGNQCSAMFNCLQETSRFGYTIDKVCFTDSCENSTTTTPGCAYNESASSIEANVFLAEDPWKADLQALTTQLSMRVCLRCDKVGYSSGGGGSSISASCSSACEECERAYCVFVS